jgi:hypothetical protein
MSSWSNSRPKTALGVRTRPLTSSSIHSRPKTAAVREKRPKTAGVAKGKRPWERLYAAPKRADRPKLELRGLDRWHNEIHKHGDMEFHLPPDLEEEAEIGQSKVCGERKPLKSGAV